MNKTLQIYFNEVLRIGLLNSEVAKAWFGVKKSKVNRCCHQFIF